MRIRDWSSDVCSSDLEDAEDEHDARRREIGDALHHHAAEIAEVNAGKRAGDQREDQRNEDQRDDRRQSLGHDQRHERSEEHTSELQSLMRNSYAVFCLKKNKIYKKHKITIQHL